MSLAVDYQLPADEPLLGEQFPQPLRHIRQLTRSGGQDDYLRPEIVQFRARAVSSEFSQDSRCHQFSITRGRVDPQDMQEIPR